VLTVSESVGFRIMSEYAQRSLFSGVGAGYPYFCDLLIVAEHPWWNPFRNPSSLVPESVLSDVRTIPGVEWAEPYVGDILVYFSHFEEIGGMQYREWYVRHKNGTEDGHSSDVFLAGVDSMIEKERLEGKVLLLNGSLSLERENSAIVGYKFAESNNITVGDTVIFTTDNFGAEHDVPGAFHGKKPGSLWEALVFQLENPWQERFSLRTRHELRLEVSGIFWSKTPYDNFIVTSYKSLQNVFGLEERVTSILVKLNTDADVGQILNSLWSMPGVNIYTPTVRKHYVKGSQVVVATEVSGISPTRYVNIANLQIALLLEVATAAFIMAVVFTNVTERRVEIGLLRAVGFKVRFVISILMAEALILGLVAGLIGFFVASALSILSNTLLLSILPQIGLKLTVEWWITAIALSTVTSIFSSLLPAYRAATVPPIDAMRRG